MTNSGDLFFMHYPSIADKFSHYVSVGVAIDNIIGRDRVPRFRALMAWRSTEYLSGPDGCLQHLEIGNAQNILHPEEWT